MRSSVRSKAVADAPEILFALWLYATLEGVGSARAVARLTQEHDAYRWICGGVQVNDHTLSDFRTAHGEVLDALLTDSVAALLAVGAVTLKRVAQDGIRIRASAGAASFRRGETLERCLEAAQAQVEALKRQCEDDPGATTRRQQAARERAARERQERIEQALTRLPQMAEIKTKQGKKAEAARVSTTDAEATVMTMADGGYRPADNGQFVSDTASHVVVGVEAATAGTDMAQLTPMIEQVNERYGQAPDEWLVDGGYPAHEQLEQAAASTVVYAPRRKTRRPIRTSPKRAPANPSPRGANAWAPTRRRTSTKNGHPRPSASTPRRASAASPVCGSAAPPKRAVCCYCMPWLIT
ncbi:transposase [Thiocystis violascens DSM 198]|uniref:Transposase n=1 Tax=Thiocystis violascens (strain ATCC 17096 / DSM 198 / 6111) TaxID=765911 RepID=G4DZ72_THIV6|nr:transposase [Thiocystis violascens DSM 198]